jgi:hypothetical protein
MDRSHVVLKRLGDERREDDFVPGSPAERIQLVWPVTVELASLSPEHDVERRLQRHVVRLVRRGS